MVLPGWVALPLFIAGPAVLLLLLTGALEGCAVRVLHGGRALRPEEVSAFAPVVQILCEHEALPGDFRLYLVPGSTGWDAWGTGRGAVLITEDLLWDVARGSLDARSAAALAAHATGRVRTGLTRSDTAIEFWSLPWTVLRLLFTGLLTGAAALPLVPFAWRVRFVVGAVAVAQAGLAGHYGFALTIALIVLLSYLTPRWRRHWVTLSERVADEYVSATGLGIALGRALTAMSTTPETMRRVQRLTGHPSDHSGVPAHRPPGRR